MATGEQIINVDLNKRLFLDKEILKRILITDEIKDLPVVVISIVGTYRQGKSFILNFFLRYLNNTCKEKKNVNDWLKTEDSTLSGFVWKNSSKRETVGIVMWSEVFISQLPSGEKVGIILMDTQGTYDNQTDLNDFATIFALSTLLSSVQIYNLKDNIKQNDLMSLKDFLDYGRLIKDENSWEAPFQNLLFLIRDWVCLEEFQYGEDGGLNYVRKQLEFNPDDAENVTALKGSVKLFFNNTFGFLLPYPGAKVVTKATNNLGEMDDEFKTYVKLLVEKVLKPENLVVKQINENIITVSDFCILIEKYHEAFKDGKMPRLESIFQASAEAQHQSALEQSVKLYEREMNFDKNPESNSEENAALRDRHETTKNSTLEEFNKMRKMGDEETNQRYRTMLAERLDNVFVYYETLNQMKLEREEHQRQEDEINRRTQETEKITAELKEEIAHFKVKSEEDRKSKAEMEEKLRQKESERIADEKSIRELEVAREKWTSLTQVLVKGLEVATNIGGRYWDHKTQVETEKIRAQGSQSSMNQKTNRSVQGSSGGHVSAGGATAAAPAGLSIIPNPVAAAAATIAAVSSKMSENNSSSKNTNNAA